MPVPKHLAPVFIGRRLLLGHCMDIYDLELKVIDTVAQADSACYHVDVEALRVLFETIRQHIVANIPAYVCRQCRQAPDPNCHCGGKGWLTITERNMPEVVLRAFGLRENSNGHPCCEISPTNTKSSQPQSS